MARKQPHHRETTFGINSHTHAFWIPHPGSVCNDTPHLCESLIAANLPSATNCRQPLCSFHRLSVPNARAILKSSVLLPCPVTLLSSCRSRCQSHDRKEPLAIAAEMPYGMPQPHTQVRECGKAQAPWGPHRHKKKNMFLH